MPSNLQIICANHLETLADALADLVKSDPGGRADTPLAAENIVVQSKGMQRWISMAIARRNGICANFNFPFPNTFLEEIYSTAFGPLPECDSFTPQTMTFRIMTLLNDLKEHAAFAPVRGYLSAAASDLKQYQLAGKIADIFDQYLVFRPDLITAWEKEPGSAVSVDAAWQRLLWRNLRGQTDDMHRADLQKKLVRRLKQMNHPLEKLPNRVSVFGISYLPVFHLQVLDALACRIPVYLFLLNPCRQYWADIVSDRQMTRFRSRQPTAAASQQGGGPHHLERGNRLLASWGHLGRQFFGLTQQMEGEPIDLFTDNPSQTILGRIQQDILDLKDRAPSDEPLDPATIDASLQIHLCHSPMREVEALHDRLLGILDDNEDIQPADILVMTPDIGRYAPYIHAVFGKGAAEEALAIPYTVADQSLPRESRATDAFLHVLDLIDGRFEASRILGLLTYDAIRKRFGIETADLSRIEDWVREANIRWGWDDISRKRHGLPGTKENTWRMGLDRLLLGYAMSSRSDELFAGISPHPGIEGSDAIILGAFTHFCETLHLLIEDIPARASLLGWQSALNTILETMFEPDETSIHDIQMLRAIPAQLERIHDGLHNSPDISFEVLRQFVIDHLQGTSYGTGFLGGGVTFCAMLPMRSIPARVICLLGMQHDTFPRELKEPGFNLMTSEPRPGDRSKRDDDKYLFLEALLSARDIFYVSFIGRDIQDNSPKPPSVLVNELLEYIQEDLGVERDRVVIEHPLQSFSAAYFDPDHPNLFSYSAENLEASRHLYAKGQMAPFFESPLPEPSADWRHCNLEQLCHFFSHPVRYLMEQRLGITFRDATEPITDIEAFNLMPLEAYKVGQEMFRCREEGAMPGNHFRALQASGELPHGKAGMAVYDTLLREVDAFAQS
ncbi:MAG: exodeoxyribonuclease V subunit gamma, partial [Desulfobacteraceae bacterium]